MRWVTYEQSDGTAAVGLVVADEIRALRDTHDVTELLGDDGEKLASAAQRAMNDPREVLALAEKRLLAPIRRPPSVRDFMAFEAHVINTRQVGQQVEPVWYEQPGFYFSNPAAIHAPGDDVAIPPGCERFDYEVEVAAVIGLGGRDLTADQAGKHIAGYTVLVDWSARDLQRAEFPFGLGPSKGKDSATTLGPFLVTPEELEPVRAGRGFNLAMMAHVNGRLYSKGSWAEIYWSFEEMLAYASRGTQLVPGDIIGSGTVGTGCILELANLNGTETYPWLVPGDEVRVTVEQLGEVLTRVAPGTGVLPLPKR